jgi:hypothetical protein
VPRCLVLLCLSTLLGSSMNLAADSVPRAQRPPAKAGAASHAEKPKKPPKSPSAFTPEREAAAMEFVRRHHPELAALVAELKKTESAEYQRAVSVLFRAGERLAHVQQRNPEAYPRELKEWKLGSRIQLLVARIRMTPDDEKLRRDLAQALSDQFDLRCARLVEERAKLASRLAKLEDQIQQMREDRDAMLEKQLEILVREKKKHSIRDKDGSPTTYPPSKPAP